MKAEAAAATQNLMKRVAKTETKMKMKMKVLLTENLLWRTFYGSQENKSDADGEKKAKKKKKKKDGAKKKEGDLHQVYLPDRGGHVEVDRQGCRFAEGSNGDEL